MSIVCVKEPVWWSFVPTPATGLGAPSGERNKRPVADSSTAARRDRGARPPEDGRMDGVCALAGFDDLEVNPRRRR